ncbi:MAG TPA: MMPL family transporter, partial [Beijerinckiaceae bacterium]|nr:MMPL family transporter [Beijerinckiaceae bacterium]
MLTTLIVKIVDVCTRRAWVVMGLATLVTFFSLAYVAGHFAINTNSDDLISTSLPWRQRQIQYNRLFTQRQNVTLVVIDGATPELAAAAAEKLNAKLQDIPDLVKSATETQGSAFFAKNGLLFESTDQVQKSMTTLTRARPFIGSLAADPSLRGLSQAITEVLGGIRTGQTRPEDFEAPIRTLSDALDSILAGKPTFFSWQAMLSNSAPAPSDLRKFIQVIPVLDYSALEPGQRASDAIRQAATDLDLTPQTGVTVRLTGDVPLEDQEFATVREGAWLNYGATTIVVLALLYMALRSFRIVLGVFTSVFVGLAVTAAVGLMMVHSFNLISIAFAVLFLGIGADFGIQFSVRYRAERHSHGDLRASLTRAAARAGRPLALAAAATALGFYAFLPTVYKGVSELGMVAGTGMIIAFVATITVLPAVLTLLRPPSEAVPIGYAFLAPVDRFLSTHRFPVIIGTFVAVL